MEGLRRLVAIIMARGRMAIRESLCNRQGDGKRWIQVNGMLREYKKMIIYI